MYDKAWADAYARLADASIPGRQGLYRLCVAALRDVPADARILVVGAGTGEELMPLAQALPEASFVAVEPAAAMADACAARLAEHGLSHRVQLHRGLLDELPRQEPFAAATAILVSQHLRAVDGARVFFDAIHARLVPGAVLFSADAHVPTGFEREWLMQLWCTQIECTGIPRDQVLQMRARIEDGIAIRAQADLEAQMQAAGLVEVRKLFSSLIYGAWCSRTASTAVRSAYQA